MKKAVCAIATVCVAATSLLAMQSGCMESCHDELYVDVGADLAGAQGNACSVTLQNAEKEVVYQCPATSNACGVDAPKTPCSPVGSAPVLADCTCSACNFEIVTQNNAEGSALENALNGLSFSISATCGSNTIYSNHSGIQTQRCD